jgi:hypothetical protein
MPHPVHPILPGLALDVIEYGWHVVTHHVVDSPRRLTQLPQRGLPDDLVDPINAARPTVFSRAPDVKEIDLVAAFTELSGEMVVSNGPERGVEPQSMTQNDRQLTRIRKRRAVMANPQPPSV